MRFWPSRESSSKETGKFLRKILSFEWVFFRKDLNSKCFREAKSPKSIYFVTFRKLSAFLRLIFNVSRYFRLARKGEEPSNSRIL